MKLPSQQNTVQQEKSHLVFMKQHEHYLLLSFLPFSCLFNHPHIADGKEEEEEEERRNQLL
ncbi:CLUMA_CG011625, isoform A [Clunio marinus]|uniref:CLUMA_CG011625, isoform A n=1 Tax=Clunio marinus TaxID=568069 RepID=A0A1J1IDA0_9DIPT|nr:CLUMA_CG011625, isoform A [Clunio marinus]